MPLPLLKSNDPVVLREQFEAWMAGARAAAVGGMLSENPYASRSRQGDAWENGFEQVEAGMELNASEAEERERLATLRGSAAAVDYRTSSDQALLAAGVKRAADAIEKCGMAKSTVLVATRSLGSVWLSIERMSR